MPKPLDPRVGSGSRTLEQELGVREKHEHVRVITLSVIAALLFAISGLAVYLFLALFF
jgi:hypothetical protein